MHRPHSNEPFTLDRNEIAVLHDEIHERLKQAEKCLPDAHGSVAFLENLLYPGVAFAMLDNKPYQESIWKMLRPRAERPFREESEATASSDPTAQAGGLSLTRES